MDKHKALTLPLKAEYFDAIRDGTKLVEYRLVTPYWIKRLRNRSYDTVILTKGYPKSDDQSRRMTRKWEGCYEHYITHPHFSPDPVRVFAIPVALSSSPLGEE